MPPRFNLSLTNLSNVERRAPIAVNDDGSARLTIKTASVEPGAIAEEWRIPIGDMSGGLAADRVQNPRGYIGTSGSGADTSWPNAWTLPPKTNSITLTSAAAMGSNDEVRMAVEYGGALYVMSGRYVHSVSTGHSVSTARDLGSGNVGSWLVVVGGSLFVCCGATDPVHKRNSAGTWSTSADVYAQVIIPTRETVWRVRSTTGTIDNTVSGIPTNTSSLETAMMTAANWTGPATTAGYVVGDSSYQVTCGVQYNGQAWFGRNDGMFQSDVNGQYFNRTPQLQESPIAGNCIGSAVIFGSLFVPSKNRGLLRVRSGESIAVGPEMTGAPNRSWWVRSMVEWDGTCYMLATDEQGGSRQSILKMMTVGSGRGMEYAFHELLDVSASNKSPWIQVFQSTTNPEIFYGGGSATTSGTYFRLGRGGGRDIDDGNYQYNSPAEVVTGNIYPAKDRAMVARLHGVDVLASFAGTSPTLAIDYNVDNYVGTEPNISMYTDRENVGGSTVNTSGRSRFYASTTSSNSVGSAFNFKFTLTQGGTPAGTTRSMVHDAYAFGVTVPKVTDFIQVTVDVGASDTLDQNGKRMGVTAKEWFRSVKEWQATGELLTMKLDGYEEGRTTRVMVPDATEIASLGLQTNRPSRSSLITLVLKRMDYEGDYAQA